MEAIRCPYCGEQNHTSSPASMAECAYCDWKFAEVRYGNHMLVILDKDMPGVWDKAEELKGGWRESGEKDKEAIVDRRISREERSGEENRRYFEKGMVLH